MARLEQDREDILREAVALVERIELRLPGYEQPVVIGFRGDGAASIFVGADPVFQFNSRGQLRRGYLNGRLIKAEDGRLISLERQRSEAQVQLLRHDFTDVETAEFLELAKHHLDTLDHQLRTGVYEITGQVPTDVDVIGRVAAWLGSLGDRIEIASRPNVS